MIRSKLFLITVLLMTLTGCSHDYYLGEENPEADYSASRLPILFGGAHSNATRSDAAGDDAARMLGNEFRVFGTFTRNGAETVDFDNYCITYDPTQRTDSTTGWIYEGNKSLSANPIVQSEKYWNPNADEYNFVAFSGLDNSVVINSDSINSFYVDAGNIGNIFVSDRVTTELVPSEEDASSKILSTNTVTFQFKHLSTHIRLAVYETVPGYAVKNLRFYYGDNSQAADGTSTKTEAGFSGKFPASGTYTITYDNNNNVCVDCEPSTTSDSFLFGELAYTTAESNRTEGGYLKADGSVADEGDKAFISSSKGMPTYACKDAVIDGSTIENSQWQVIMPYPNNDTNLELRADFDLVPLDGSKSIVSVYGAKAIIEVTKHAQWKPNHAYTYLFHISENSQALKAIILDAVVSDEDYTEYVIPNEP